MLYCTVPTLTSQSTLHQLHEFKYTGMSNCAIIFESVRAWFTWTRVCAAVSNIYCSPCAIRHKLVLCDAFSLSSPPACATGFATFRPGTPRAPSILQNVSFYLCSCLSSSKKLITSYRNRRERHANKLSCFFFLRSANLSLTARWTTFSRETVWRLSICTALRHVA